ncbi:MAG: hypothetical protein ABI851_00725 [Saprospiraceae bacterium]
MNTNRKNTIKFSELFQKFRRIPYEGYNEYIAFCKFHFKEIQDLQFEEYIEIKFAYIKAIYNIDGSFLFYKVVDQTIFEILNQQAFSEQYRNIYKQILLLKAKRLLEEKKILAAKKIYISVFSIDRFDPVVERKLYHIILKQKFYSQIRSFGITVIALIITLVLSISINFFIIPFLPEYEALFKYLAFTFFLVSICIFSTSSLLAYYRAKKELFQIRNNNLEKE